MEVATKPRYASPWGLLPFQAQAVMQAFVKGRAITVYDTGIGKSHVAMASAALGFEEDAVDLVVICCEKNKVDEWPEDFARYTDLTVKVYMGDLKRRAKIRIALPEVLVSTYHTMRNDLTVKQGRSLAPGPLMEAMAGKRVLVVYDEIALFNGRGSGIYKAHEMLLSRIKPRVLGLTATAVERDPVSFFNLCRLVDADLAGTVAGFEKDYVRDKDTFGNPTRFKNLSPERLVEPWVTPLNQRLSPLILRKRKTDPDVVDQFPKVVEEPPTMVTLGSRHLDFYRTVLETFEDAEEPEQRRLTSVLRMIAGHPLSLLHSKGKVAEVICEQVGHDGLKALGCAKLDALTAGLTPIVLGQGDQAVVFSFFGPSMIPLIAAHLRAAGISTVTNTGSMTTAARRDAMATFKAGRASVLLSSDAGARGINLPMASYVIEYEGALTHANATQRFNRINRIDSPLALNTYRTLVARDTIEEGLYNLRLKRNAWSDTLLGDDDAGENFITAAQRAVLFRYAKRG